MTDKPTTDKPANTDLTTKLAQFDEFFSIEHKFTVNLTSIEHNQMPSFEQFVNQMPLPFKIASDIVSLDQAALRPIQGLSGVAGQLVEFLNHQAQKIDLLVGYILSQQDEKDYRYQGIKFGGGGLVFTSNKPFELGQLFEMKIFLLEDNCAVYSLGEIIDISEVPTNDTPSEAKTFNYKVIYHYLREEDQEVLVRTSLHQQSKQLQALSQKRKNDH